MKKGTKCAVAFGGVLLAAGLSLFLCGMAMEDWDFSALATVHYEQREYTAQADVTELTVDVKAANVRTEVSEEAERVYISYPVRTDKDGNVLAEVTVTEENGAIALTEEDGDPQIGIGFGSPAPLTVTLPAGTLTKISFTADTGDIALAGVQAGQIICTTDAGNITAENVRAEELVLASDTGDIRAAGASVGKDLSVRTDTGDVRAENVAAGGRIAAETDTGDIALSGTVQARKIEAGTRFGKIDAETPLTAEEMDFATETGDVSLLVRGVQAEFTVIAETETGNSNVASAIGGEKALVVRTESGNIRVEFIQ